MSTPEFPLDALDARVQMEPENPLDVLSTSGVIDMAGATDNLARTGASASGKDFVAISWNLHKGRTPLGFQAWQAMQRWVQSTPADVYFLQEAMARRVSPLARGTEKEKRNETREEARKKAENDALAADVSSDAWHCQATEIARALRLRIALGPNVFRQSWRHGNAILSPHPLDLSGRWDISAHRFERRGLLAARANFAAQPVTLLCAHLALTRSARLRQMTWIAHWIAKQAPHGPLVLAGDFNDWRNDSVPLFAEHGLREVATVLGEPARTFPAFSPALALDKMFVRAMTPIEWLPPAHETAWLSDHLPYMARLRVD